MKQKIIFFMPAMEGGGVEKNLVMIANFFSKKKINVSIISFDQLYKKKFNKNINFITEKTQLKLINI